MDNYRYNYIIAGGTGYYDVAYSDLKKLPNVVYHNQYISGLPFGLIKLLARVNFNIALNRFIHTPLSFLVNRFIYPDGFDDSKPRCYIFFQNHYAVINTSYLSYLRKKHPSAKFVLYMQDIVASTPYYDMNDYKRKFDLILSYDKGDCAKYKLTYYPTPYSKIDDTKLPQREPIDVYYCGAGKTRYPVIFDVYKKCISEGLKCKFFVFGVPVNERITGDGLIYDQRISYVENISYVLSSKCILEVMQENADGYTPRLWESILYDKLLLTNNISIINSNIFKRGNIHLVHKDYNIKNWINDQVYYPNDVKLGKSPINLLKLLEHTL